MPGRKRSRDFVGIFILLGFFVTSYISTGCARKERLPEFHGNFESWIEETSRAMCDKMQRCYGKIFRTLPTEKRKALTSRQCVATVLRSKEEKLKRHTPLMKALAVQCYTNVLRTPCKKFAETAFFDPACVQLNLLADKAYKGQKADLGKLPWE